MTVLNHKPLWFFRYLILKCFSLIFSFYFSEFSERKWLERKNNKILKIKQDIRKYTSSSFLKYKKKN